MPELQTEGTDNRRRAPSAAGTIGLVVVISAVFGLQMLWTGAPVIGGRGRTLEVLIAMGAGIGREAVLHGEWWRLFSPMLLHGSLGHVASNLMAIYFTGTMLEMFLGWRRLVVLFVVSGAGGCLASQYLVAWLIARLKGVEAAREVLHYFAPVGEKQACVERALSHVTPCLEPCATAA